MRTGIYNRISLLSVLCLFILLGIVVEAAPSPEFATRSDSNPLNIDWGPDPPPEEGPPLSAGALRDTTYLPAQIGGIVGAYAVSLVLVAITLLSLAKRRREHLEAADEPEKYEPSAYAYPATFSAFENQDNFPYPVQSPTSPVRNFSYPSPTSPTQEDPGRPYIYPSPISTVQAPGIDLAVDQAVVSADREMAQAQLEDMYKYVMEQEAAKEAGIVLDPPVIPGAQPRQAPTNSSTTTLTKKERMKPSSLNLNKEEKTQSRTSSILSALKSPRKKKMQGMSISSPIMTPMSGTFPRYEGEEMSAIPPRQYAPAAPPPIPTDQAPYRQQQRAMGAPLTPDISPQSTQSIDERIGVQLGQPPQRHARDISSATTEADPVSAASEKSTTPLVGLPSSPKPGVTRFPSLASLPSSPKPGATFSRPNAPSAVRTGGTLPLRAYEPSLASPSASSHQTKQTVFERAGPLSPGGQRTPWTGAPVPYSPYQPFSPVVPMTPSLVTKADRKRMKRMEPKTPTVEMVRSTEDLW
ncbi:uncharacterized protein E0L32_001348 [Thyridium curvatum]|uniref:Uncharacterized protein n=1 Tax=Thyridium curvatum TaxID=1093900 RepID=A0A507AZ72_9PEZI|nr:uncharacterized protein E0L32_001348 [Thyridium curvatum]TPX10151.1 hypothetical protein E0L32_001348 [Thyridium curvatum]